MGAISMGPGKFKAEKAFRISGLTSIECVKKHPPLTEKT